MFGALMVFFILAPAAGLAIDVGMMYLVQSLLSAASDGAALAGARAFSRGSDDSQQRANAEATANAYLRANFPSGYMFSTDLSVDSHAATDSDHVRSLTTNASVRLPLIFLRLFRTESTLVSTSSKATRRDANVMIIMDRSSSLQSSGACTPLKKAAINFVNKFAEGRDNLGLITFATSSRVDNALSATFKTAVTATLNQVKCTGYTNSSQALWQGYDALVTLNQPGALNALVFFTDGRPTAVTEDFPIKPSPGDNCTPKTQTGVVIDTPDAVYVYQAPPQPMTSDQTLISGTHHCDQPSVSHIQYAPLLDHWLNSLTATGYKSVTYSGDGLKISSGSNVENFSTNAADHAALRVRRADPDPDQANRSLEGVVIYSIGLGDVDEVFLKRVSNDVSLSPNPVAAGAHGKYEYAGDASQLNDAFTRVASEVLRLAQ
jgi:Mg-chelatase subunit ChlD